MLHQFLVHSSFATVYTALHAIGHVSIELTGPAQGVLHIEGSAGLIDPHDEGVRIRVFAFDDGQHLERLVTMLRSSGLRVDDDSP